MINRRSRKGQEINVLSPAQRRAFCPEPGCPVRSEAPHSGLVLADCWAHWAANHGQKFTSPFSNPTILIIKISLQNHNINKNRETLLQQTQSYCQFFARSN